MKFKLSALKKVIREAAEDASDTQVFQDWLLENGHEVPAASSGEWVDTVLEFCEHPDEDTRRLARGAWKALPSGSLILASPRFQRYECQYQLAVFAVARHFILKYLKENENAPPQEWIDVAEVSNLGRRSLDAADAYLQRGPGSTDLECFNLKTTMWPIFTDVDFGTPSEKLLDLSISLMGMCSSSSRRGWESFRDSLLDKLEVYGEVIPAEVITKTVPDPCA